MNSRDKARLLVTFKVMHEYLTASKDRNAFLMDRLAQLAAEVMAGDRSPEELDLALRQLSERAPKAMFAANKGKRAAG